MTRATKLERRWQAAVRWAVDVVGVSDWDSRFHVETTLDRGQTLACVRIEPEFHRAIYVLNGDFSAKPTDDELRALAVHEAEHVWRHEHEEAQADHVAEVARRALQIKP